MSVKFRDVYRIDESTLWPCACVISQLDEKKSNHVTQPSQNVEFLKGKN